MAQKFPDKVEITSTAPADANDGQLQISEQNGKIMLLGRAVDHGFVQSHNGEPLVLNPLGNNVGIGTVAPTRKLDVQGGQIRILNQGDGAVLLELSSERSWQLRQLGTGPRTHLELASIGGGNKNFVINTTGGVGIGTTLPREALEVNGNIFATGDVILPGADCAEEFEIDRTCLSKAEPGTVMVLDDEGRLRPSATAYDRRVAGVVSGAGSSKPGIILGRQADHMRRKPLALMGKVFCKVDATGQPVAVGDMLTTSSTPGHAMKAADRKRAFGAVLGKALRPLKDGCGLVPILVTLQ